MLQGLRSSDERFLAAISNTAERLETAQRQLSSGKKMERASDEPDQISAALAARADLEQTQQISLNLGTVKSEVDTSEQTLQSVVNILDRLRVLGVQGSSETLPVAQRATLAVEVDAILEQLVNAANTVVAGRYVFGGDTDNTPPYSIVPAEDGVDANITAYAGTASTRQVMHPNGTRFSVAHSAEDIFDSSAGSVFQGVLALRDALKSGPAEDDPDFLTKYQAQTTAIDDALTAVKASGTHLNDELAFYGVVQDRITEATNFCSELVLRQKQQLSSVVDADIAAAAVELSQAQLQMNTSLQARARITSSSLFDYLR